MKFGPVFSSRPQLLTIAAFAALTIAPTCPAQTETVLHNFAGATGSNPLNGVVASDRFGNLYGSTDTGGSSGSGVLFCLTHDGRYFVLHNFNAFNGDGIYPAAGVTLDPITGSLYGTTNGGGTTGNGTIYKLDSSGQYSIVHNFTAGVDGAIPLGQLTLGAHGNLFGTAEYGGAGGAGVVYKVDPAGQFTVIYAFTGGGDEGLPYSGVTFDTAGNLYGTTLQPATVYKIDKTGKETVLLSFNGGAGGDSITAGVAVDPAGNIFGTAEFGGDFNNGLVFELDPEGNETVLHSFAGAPDGALPEGLLAFDAAGNLYGSTELGGSSNAGTIFKVDGETHAVSVVYSFSGPDGASPSGVLLPINNNVFGTTYGGGANGSGVIFRLATTH